MSAPLAWLVVIGSGRKVFLSQDEAMRAALDDDSDDPSLVIPLGALHRLGPDL